jgi:lysophospholipase L1-like esterase
VKRALKVILSWLLVAAITFGALEGVCRLLDPLGISYYPETAKWLGTLEVQDPVGYRNRPGTVGEFYGAPVRINSIGLRGPEILPKQPGEFRVLLMGDSFPFGIGVTEEQAFPAVLERLLLRDAPQGARARVINMGVVSYNSVQELRQLRELGLSLAPDAVVLSYAINDIEPVMWVLDKRRNPLANLVQRSYAGSLVAILTRNAKNALTGSSPVDMGAYRPDSPGWRAVDRSLAEMNALCREAGIPFVVFHIFEDVPALRALLTQLGRREGFPVMEVFPSGDPRYAALDPSTLVNSAMDLHPNVEGNIMWAELLRKSLRGHLGAWRY